MIAYIRGKVTHKEPNRVIVDVGGIGYGIFVPISTYERMPELGSEVKLNISQVVRENEISLYGFLTEEELTVFQLVTSVSGAGPKAAMGILSKITPVGFKSAILNDDIAVLRSAPGIGARMAQRLIVELKDKVDSIPGEMGAPGTSKPDIVGQAIAAIRELGSTKAVAERAVGQAFQILGRDTTLEDLVKLALRFTI